VHCAMMPERGLGVAIKGEDGAVRAAHTTHGYNQPPYRPTGSSLPG
jgi:hypothetical protein